MSWNNLTYRQRVIVIHVAGLIMLYTAYQLSLKPTIELGRQKKEIQQQLAEVKNAPEQIAYFTKELNMLNTYMSDKESMKDNHEALHEYISRYTERNQLVFAEYPGKHKLKANDLEIETSTVVVKGTFHKLLMLLYNLETKARFGKILSVSFYSHYNKQRKEKELYLKVYVRVIKPGANEKS